MKKLFSLQRGQMLVMMLIYMLVALMITTAAITMLYITTQTSEKITQGSETFDIAESGAETAIIKLLRDPNYSGETLPIGNGQATITVTGTGSARTIYSEGVRGNFRRRLEIEIDYTDNILEVNSWKEI
jgi:hypothetical protein